MPEYPLAGRLLAELIPVATSSMGKEEMMAEFSRVTSQVFAIDKVGFADAKEKHEPGVSTIYDYIRNTRKAYVDNQLSEYSSFAELVGYKNSGYHSCALIPVMAGGKVVSLIEMLSSSEGKFSDEIVSSVLFAASFVGFAMVYKEEAARSMKLATYFDAAFSSIVPQLIVDASGSIVRSNKAAMRAFQGVQPQGGSIASAIGMDPSKLSGIKEGAYQDTIIKAGEGQGKVYTVAAARISGSLFHLSVLDSTNEFAFVSLIDLIGKSSEVVVVFTGADFSIRSSSANSERIFGYSSEVLENGNLLEIVEKVEQSALKARLAEDLGGGKDVSAGAVNLAFNENNRMYMRYLCRRFLDGYLFLMTKAEMERYVDSARRDLEDFIGSTSDIVLTLDRLGFVTNCNMQAETVLGYKRAELVGKDIKAIYADPSLLDRDIGIVYNSGKVDNTFIQVKASDERIIPATHSIRILASGTPGKSEAYLVIIKELETKARMHQEEEVIQDQQVEIKRYRSESELKTQFIYNVTHELRTPLTSIKGFSKLLYDGDFGQLNGEQRESIKTILDETDRLALVIQQVLDAAKLEAQKVKLELKDVDIQGMANNPSIKALEEMARNRGLAFEWTVDFNVPRISADPNRLIQVFVNLIGNAIKFTEHGSIRVHTSRLNRGSIKCEVIDTGIGIQEDDQKKLFKKKFYEAAKKGLAQHPGAGTGLGLSITRDIVKLHGGKISFSSTPGKGSTFWFTLPIARKQRRRSKAQEQQRPEQAAQQQEEAVAQDVPRGQSCAIGADAAQADAAAAVSAD